MASSVCSFREGDRERLLWNEWPKYDFIHFSRWQRLARPGTELTFLSGSMTNMIFLHVVDIISYTNNDIFIISYILYSILFMSVIYLVKVFLIFKTYIKNLVFPDWILTDCICFWQADKITIKIAYITTIVLTMGRILVINQIKFPSSMNLYVGGVWLLMFELVEQVSMSINNTNTFMLSIITIIIVYKIEPVCFNTCLLMHQKSVAFHQKLYDIRVTYMLKFY